MGRSVFIGFRRHKQEPYLCVTPGPDPREIDASLMGVSFSRRAGAGGGQQRSHCCGARGKPTLSPVKSAGNKGRGPQEQERRRRRDIFDTRGLN